MAGLTARQLVNDGVDVLVLERGRDHEGVRRHRLPSQRDELRWGVRNHLAQDWSIETYTLRHSRDETALPIRTVEAFLPGLGRRRRRQSLERPVPCAGPNTTHSCARASSRALRRGGAFPATCRSRIGASPIRSWSRTTKLFEKLFGIAGKAGNLRGKIQAGGNPFEAPRAERISPATARDHRGRSDLLGGRAKLGYKPFPMRGVQLTGAYTNPDGMHLGSLPVLRALRALHLRGECQGLAGNAAVSGAAGKNRTSRSVHSAT